MREVKVSVAGFSVVDTLYGDIDFKSESYRSLLSKRQGDGGLESGRLTFVEDLEKFAGEPFKLIMEKLAEGRAPSGRNLGGPAIVGAVNAAQILHGEKASFRFFGTEGSDAEAVWLAKTLSRLPVDCSACRKLEGATPATYVLSDPRANDGKGERTFISEIGVGGRPEAGELPAEFFEGDLAWFGGTALVPPLHERLTGHLERAKKAGMFTLVNTIFDFFNEKRAPSKPWSLGAGMETYRLTDVLLMDWDEARRLSGKDELSEIEKFFTEAGVSTFVITHGAKEFHVKSDGRLFERLPLSSFRVSELVMKELAERPEKRGDTTGCGDNFAGGFAASFISQLAAGGEPGTLSISDAAAWAAASGGFACFTLGGTYFEKKPGEKRKALKRYRDAWLEQ